MTFCRLGRLEASYPGAAGKCLGLEDSWAALGLGIARWWRGTSDCTACECSYGTTALITYTANHGLCPHAACRQLAHLGPCLRSSNPEGLEERSQITLREVVHLVTLYGHVSERMSGFCRWLARPDHRQVLRGRRSPAAAL
jgi:hypothetical protein